MKKQAGDLVKSLFSSFGLFLARQFPGGVNGYRLNFDLRVIVPQSNPVCFDIGANRGQTIELLQECFVQPKIYAFEPASATYSILTGQNFGPEVSFYRLALGDKVGTLEFHNYKQSELSSFLPVHPDEKENIFAKEELISMETVSVDTLDHFCSVHGIEHIDLLKIDTQGYELPVLRGGNKMFTDEKIGAVLLELNFSTLYEGQSDPLEVIQLLRSYGMRLVDLYEKERMRGKELSWTTALFIRYKS
ncbi:MAG: FkbM family methyltransferase [Sediminibacterium sp.]